MQTMIVCEEIGELLEQLGLARKEKGFERLSYAIAVTAQEFERAGSVTKHRKRLRDHSGILLRNPGKRERKPGSRNYSVITGIIRRFVRPTVSILQSWLTGSGVAVMRMDWKVLSNLRWKVSNEIKRHSPCF